MVKLDNVSAELGVEVWAKLEESCGAWGGNKLRKLEYILAEAEHRRAEHLVSYGAGGSNWTTALALHAPRHGFGVTVVLETPPPDRYAELYRSSRVIRGS